jgi:putative ABC transport system substrate-binding protein
MKRVLVTFSIIIIIIAVYSSAAQAGRTILAIQSIRIQPYEEALNGFESVGDTTVRRIILSEASGSPVSDRIKAINPAVILAIGMDALKPVIHLMVLNPPSAISEKKNCYGIRMNIPLEQQFRALFDALPATKTVGLLYHPDKTGDLMEKVRDAGRKAGVKVIAKAVYNSKSAPGLIQEMKEQIDVFRSKTKSPL